MLNTERPLDHWLVRSLCDSTPEELDDLKFNYPHAWEESAPESFVLVWTMKAQLKMQGLLRAGVHCPSHVHGRLVFEGALNTALGVFALNEPWIYQATVLAMLANGMRPEITDSIVRNFLEVVIDTRLLTVGVMASHQSEMRLVADLIWLIEQGFELRHGAMESLQQMLSRMTLGDQRDGALAKIMDAMRTAQSKSDTRAISGALGFSANPSQTRKRM